MSAPQGEQFAETVAVTPDELMAWVTDVQRRGHRLFVEDADGWLHEFKVTTPPRIDGKPAEGSDA